MIVRGCLLAEFGNKIESWGNKTLSSALTTGKINGEEQMQ